MPAQAISPALLDLLDLMSSPILLITQSPAGEFGEMAPAKRVLAAAWVSCTGGNEYATNESRKWDGAVLETGALSTALCGELAR
jgi:hypothetical protein